MNKNTFYLYTSYIFICSVDGGWGDFGPWGKFSECTQTCGGGAMSRYRYRECDKPKPQGGGRFCSGDSVESDTERCNVISCEGTASERHPRVKNNVILFEKGLPYRQFLWFL